MSILSPAFWLVALWMGAIAVVGASIALAVVAARIRRPAIGTVGVIPVATGLLLHALGVDLPPPYPLPVLAHVLAVELFVLGVAAGWPLTLTILGLAERGRVATGSHGGIVPDQGPAVPDAPAREVLRGGATIGYLERFGVIGLAVFGRFEGIAIVVAVKGLGRVGELDSPEARERFIIGTLVSLVWAGACAALILLTA